MMSAAQQLQRSPTIPRVPPRQPEELCFLCLAKGEASPRPIYAKRVCQPHYQKAHRLGIEPQKLLELMDISPRLPNKEGVQVSPRISKSTHEALRKAVESGAAKSIYKMAARVLEEWGEAHADVEKEPSEEL